MTASALEAAPAAAPPAATRPFSAFEWMVAFRYLRARRAHGSVSVIAGFSFAGIVLGVMALIVVMSVMNGFHHDLMEKMIGLNGHVFLQGVDKPLTDYDAVTERVGKVPGVRAGAAAGRGPGLRHLALQFRPGAGARRARGRPQAPARHRGPYHPRHARRLRRGAGRRGRRAARRASEPAGRRQAHPDLAARRADAVRRHAAGQELSDRRDLPDRHGDVRQHLRLHAARRSAGLFQSRRPGQRDRGLSRRPRAHRRDARPHNRRRAAADDRHRLAPAQQELLRRARRSKPT